MSVYARGKEPPCLGKLPGCLGIIRDRNSKTCAPCFEFSRKHQLDRPVQDRLRIEDRLLDDVKDFLKTAHKRPPVLKPVARKAKGAAEHEMVLMLSDTHYPEVVDEQAAMGLKYNADICTDRKSVV